MDDVIFYNSSNCIGIRFSTNVLGDIHNECRRALNKETGGILIGYYSDNNSFANITIACGPAPDSKHGGSWFYRGVQHLDKKINVSWKRNEYYIGEWHYHPRSSPTPSGRDIKQMKNIVNDLDYRCPEVLLFIVGGDDDLGWDYNAMLFRKNGEMILLLR